MICFIDIDYYLLIFILMPLYAAADTPLRRRRMITLPFSTPLLAHCITPAPFYMLSAAATLAASADYFAHAAATMMPFIRFDDIYFIYFDTIFMPIAITSITLIDELSGCRC